MTTANIATYPARAKSLRQMLASIEGQFDLVRICLNGYDAIPDDLNHYHCEIPDTDLKDCAKFLWFNDREADEVYFTLDDDLIYPPDYRERMEALLLDYQIVTAHGHIITKQGQDWHDGHTVRTFDAHVGAMEHVHVGGTGCMAIRTKQHTRLQIDLNDWVPGQADADFALACAEERVPILLVPHVEQWIVAVKAPGGIPLATSTRKLPRLKDVGNRLLHQWKDHAPWILRKICYTVITDGYDVLRQPTHITLGWEYWLVTDYVEKMKAAGTGIWQVVDQIDKCGGMEIQRKRKAMPDQQHLHHRSVYVDGNITLTGDLDVLVLRSKHREDVVTSKAHPTRTCVYDEADAIAELGKEVPDKVDNWSDRLNVIGRRRNAGLSETNILIRDFTPSATSPIAMSMLTWAMLMEHYSYRDQLTFDLVMDMYGTANRQPTEIFDPFIKWHPHGHEVAPQPKAEPKVTKADVKPKGKAKAEEKQPSLGIIAQCPPDLVPLLPMFVMAALEHNPDAHVTCFIHPAFDVPDMQPVADRHSVMRYLIAPHSLMTGAICPPAAAHYLALPPVPRDLLFFCPINHMVLTDLRKAYLPLMEERKVGYINDSVLYDTRMSPLHFTRYDHMHPHGLLTQPNHDLMKHPDHLLWLVYQNVGAPGGRLHFSAIPETGFDVGTKKGIAEAWKAYTQTEAFHKSTENLLPEAVEYLLSTQPLPA